MFMKLRIYLLIPILYGASTQAFIPPAAAAFIQNDRLVIGADPERGFFGCFLAVLNNLEWCSRNNVQPHVYWDENSLYYQPEGYNGVQHNAWEYYFEQVSQGTFQDNELQWMGFRNVEGKGISLLKDQGAKYSTQEYREKIHKIIEKHIIVKPQITAKVDAFYKQFMEGKKTIGIHLRGTDKPTEGKQVPAATILETANALATKYPGCQFFVATDEVALLEEAKRSLHGKVIAYDSYRSPDGKPIHFYAPEYSKAKLGEEVLIEALLLTRCTAFVHTVSNVSMSVLFFNPDLQSILIRLGEKND